ncbi:unnamed protein product [Rotaria sordida]|uniref:Uncharacterized protein n=1 Tax=Rotaria sordida TaxID=392033 RepID=A0A815S5S9_9BILA|nr:unnamed protein product [Rotaria sordida]CAF1649830.1 unnamed protein product [Rotaria sordida]
MNLMNIAKHVLHLTQVEFYCENSPTSDDEILASQQLFEILKTFKDSYFNELHTYETLDFHDEYDDMTDKEDSTDEEKSNDEEESTDEEQNMDDYDDNQYLNIRNNFTLEEMEDIIEWVDEHPNYTFANSGNILKRMVQNQKG